MIWSPVSSVVSLLPCLPTHSSLNTSSSSMSLSLYLANSYAFLKVHFKCPLFGIYFSDIPLSKLLLCSCELDTNPLFYATFTGSLSIYQPVRPPHPPRQQVLELL